MSWCPFAVKMELQPESDSQAAITPTQFIVHSLAAPWSIERTYQYWRDSTNLESHFGLEYSGRIGQYIGTNTRADANAQANVRAISVETSANTSNTDPWTQEQIDSLVRLLDWAAREHNIPRRRCRSWTDPGFGYHRMYPEWSSGGTECPGNARAKQFDEIVLPRVVAAGTEGLMTLTETDLVRVADKVIDTLVGPRKAELLSAIVKTDNIIRNPNEATNEQEPYLGWTTFIQNGDLLDRRIDSNIREVLAQVKANGAMLTEILALLKNEEPTP